MRQVRSKRLHAPALIYTHTQTYTYVALFPRPHNGLSSNIKRRLQCGRQMLCNWLRWGNQFYSKWFFFDLFFYSIFLLSKYIKLFSHRNTSTQTFPLTLFRCWAFKSRKKINWQKKERWGLHFNKLVYSHLHIHIFRLCGCCTSLEFYSIFMPIQFMQSKMIK